MGGGQLVGSMRDQALAYAERGWAVFPLRPGQKSPLTRHGYKDATTDPTAIVRWWGATPDANIGCATGVAFSVLDVDGPEGNANLRPFAGDYRHPGPVSYTGKGWHFLFAGSDRKTVHGNETTFVPKVDFQSLGAYIVMPRAFTRTARPTTGRTSAAPSCRCRSIPNGSWTSSIPRCSRRA